MKRAFTLIEVLVVCCILGIVAAILLPVVGCTTTQKQTSSDEAQQRQQELLLREATAQTGMPAIKNFRERKMLKDILELRDQTGVVTYTYLWNEFNGKLIFLGETVGYGIPYATQYTNPQKVELYGCHDTAPGYDRIAIPQADPNGLFSPGSAEGTWILLKNPNGTEAKPVYVEPRIVVPPFKLDISKGRFEIE